MDQVSPINPQSEAPLPQAPVPSPQTQHSLWSKILVAVLIFIIAGLAIWFFGNRASDQSEVGSSISPSQSPSTAMIPTATSNPAIDAYCATLISKSEIEHAMNTSFTDVKASGILEHEHQTCMIVATKRSSIDADLDVTLKIEVQICKDSQEACAFGSRTEIEKINNDLAAGLSTDTKLSIGQAGIHRIGVQGYDARVVLDDFIIIRTDYSSVYDPENVVALVRAIQ